MAVVVNQITVFVYADSLRRLAASAAGLATASSLYLQFSGAVGALSDLSFGAKLRL